MYTMGTVLKHGSIAQKKKYPISGSARLCSRRIALTWCWRRRASWALRESNLVLTRRESRTIYYRLNGDDALRIIEVLQSIFCPVDESAGAAGG